MENQSKEIFITPEIQARFDHKRFPKIWQALAGVALMQFTGSGVLMLIQYALGENYSVFFGTKFNSSMLNALVSQFFAVLLIPLAFAFIFKLDFSSTFRLKKKLNFKQIILLVIISLGFFFVAQIINGIFVGTLSTFLGPPSDMPVSFETETLPQLLYVIIIAGILPAICEEFFFRGFVMRSLERTSPAGAVIISALLFAVMHGTFQQLAYAFLIGLLFGYVVIITDSIFAGTIIHCVLNTTSVLLSFGIVGEYFQKFKTTMPLIFLAITFVLAIVGVLALILFKKITVKGNEKKYSKALISELEYPRLMPKQRVYENVIGVIASVIFVLINLLNMFTVWYYEILTSLAGGV